VVLAEAYVLLFLEQRFHLQ